MLQALNTGHDGSLMYRPCQQYGRYAFQAGDDGIDGNESSLAGNSKADCLGH